MPSGGSVSVSDLPFPLRVTPFIGMYRCWFTQIGCTVQQLRFQGGIKVQIHAGCEQQQYQQPDETHQKVPEFQPHILRGASENSM